MAGGGGAATAVYTSGLIVALVLSSVQVATCAFNITQILTAYPDFSQFNDWLSRTGVATEINNRSTLTILAPNNQVLGVYLSTVPDAFNNPDKVGDTLRYHVLLTYFGIPQLQQLPANGTSVTTLLQTTGRANESEGFVTLYNNGTSFLVGHQLVDTYGNETILGNVTDTPYELSVLQVSALLSPVPPALPSPAPAPSPAKVSSPTPTTDPTIPVNGPVVSASASTDSNHAAGKKSASGILVLLAMLFASSVALL